MITLNEQERLPRCLDSLGFCDEIVVVDSGSTDRTLEIAHAAGARVITRPWQGYGAQRNAALDATACQWALELDADEWLSDEAQREVEELLRQVPDDVDVAMFPCREHFLGRPLGPSGHYPFYRPRLIRRARYRHDETVTVHEGIAPRSRPWVLGGEMHHLRAASIREAVTDGVRYARLEARQLAGASPSALLLGVLGRPPIKLAYQGLVLGGWRDGWPGLLKIGLECATDALTWILAAGRRDPAQPGWRPTRHFGRRRRQPPGSWRVLAVGRLDSAGEAWLGQAERLGAWATVIEPSPGGPFGPPADRHPRASRRRHRVPRLGPLVLIRALDAEGEVGPWEAILSSSQILRGVLRLLPASARHDAPVLSPADPQPVQTGSRRSKPISSSSASARNSASEPR